MAESREPGELVSNPRRVRRDGFLDDLVRRIECGKLGNLGEHADPVANPVTNAAGGRLSLPVEFRMRVHPRKSAVESNRKVAVSDALRCSRQNAIVRDVLIRPFLPNRTQADRGKVSFRRVGPPESATGSGAPFIAERYVTSYQSRAGSLPPFRRLRYHAWHPAVRVVWRSPSWRHTESAHSATRCDESTSNVTDSSRKGDRLHQG